MNALVQHRRRAETDSQVSEFESSLEGSSREQSKNEATPTNSRFFNISVNTSIILNIINGSIWGVLARKGLISLTTYDGAYLGGVIWANFTACIIMGIAVESSNFWLELIERNSFASKGSIPLYTGITTGFCGTCSSFSSVFLEAFNKAANTLPYKEYNYPNSAYGIMEVLAVLITQFGVSVAGFHLGKHFIELFDNYSPRLSKKSYRPLESASLVLGIVSYIIIIVLIAVEKRGTWRSWTFSVLFAPIGALLRYYLSKYFNGRFKNFPLGTFSANIIGTLLLAIFTLLIRGKKSSMSSVPIVTHVTACQLLSGLDDGLCGALTTVSTFVVELFSLNTLHSYRYGLSSIILSFILMVLLLGSYNWSVGLTNPICS